MYKASFLLKDNVSKLLGSDFKYKETTNSPTGRMQMPNLGPGQVFFPAKRLSGFSIALQLPESGENPIHGAAQV